MVWVTVLVMMLVDGSVVVVVVVVGSVVVVVVVVVGSVVGVTVSVTVLGGGATRADVDVVVMGVIDVLGEGESPEISLASP